MKRLYFKVDTTGRNKSEENIPDEVCRVCYIVEEDDKIVEKGDDYIKPKFRDRWPEASMVNGIWPERVADCPYMEHFHTKYMKLFHEADEIVMDHPRFTRDMCLQSGLSMPEGKKYVDVVDCFTKQHPSIAKAEGKRRCTLEDAVKFYNGICEPVGAEEKCEEIRNVFKKLPVHQRWDLTELDILHRNNTLAQANYKCTIHGIASVACESLEHKDSLFDAESEKTFYVNEEQKYYNRRKEIISAVVNTHMRLHQIESVMMSRRAEILAVNTHKDARRHTKQVAYDIRGTVYHQNFSAEDLDVRMSIERAKQSRQWYSYEAADKLRTKGGEFDMASRAERMFCLKSKFKKGGENDFVPMVDKMSKGLQVLYGAAKAGKGEDVALYKYDLEEVVGKKWEDIWKDIEKDFGDYRESAMSRVNVPLRSLVLFDKDGLDSKLIVRGELLTAFRASRDFYENCDKEIGKFCQKTFVMDNRISNKLTGVENKEDAFKLTVLASGSMGNCALIQTKDENILMDYGLGVQATNPALRKLGMSYRDIDAVFISHEHMDHAKLSKTFLRSGAKVFATVGTWQGIAEKNKYEMPFNAKNCYIMPDKLTMPSGLEIRKVETCHDTNDPCMYSFTKDGQTLTWVTDTGKVTSSMKEAVNAADILVIEANHDTHLLQVDPKHERFSQCRVRSEQGHLSNAETEDLLVSLENPPKSIYLAHSSIGSNSLEMVMDMVESARKRNPLLENTTFTPLRQSELVEVNTKGRPEAAKPEIEIALKERDEMRKGNARA